MFPRSANDVIDVYKRQVHLAFTFIYHLSLTMCSVYLFPLIKLILQQAHCKKHLVNKYLYVYIHKVSVSYIAQKINGLKKLQFESK